MKHQNRQQLLDKLQEAFGHIEFKSDQEAIIENVLAGKNTLAIMPTGGGKSLCYQLPALLKSGTAIVISPLLALMKNQVDFLNGAGIPAAFLNSTLSKKVITELKDTLLTGQIKLLYVAPESLTKEETLALLEKVNISFIAVDEAHCISEWGDDFRPEYRKIRPVVERLGNVAVIALTATATPKVQLDILKTLSIEGASLFRSSFDRKNLYYEVRHKVEADKQLVQFIQQYKDQAGVIYCHSRKKVEEITAFLKLNDIAAVPYHAGLEAAVRMQNQDAFLSGATPIIVATIAFGMGIDKGNVRFVVHYDMPRSLEGYYQETGRAGRDDKKASCLLFYTHRDLDKLDKFNKDKPVAEREKARALLQEVKGYAVSGLCRRRQLLAYFGEHYNAPCNNCDNCNCPTKRYEGNQYIVILLQGLQLGQNRLKEEHIINLIRGNENPYTTNYIKNDKYNIFGKGADRDASFWHSVVRQARFAGFLQKENDSEGVLILTKMGEDFLEHPHDFQLSEDHVYDDVQPKAKAAATAASNLQYKGHDEGLYRLLTELRNKIAKQNEVSPYLIFQEKSLEEMATTYPTTLEALGRIMNVGIGKAKKFGEPFITLIKQYVEENELEPISPVVVKAASPKYQHKVYIIRQVDKKVDLEDIAEAQSLTLDELLKEMEQICHAGVRININYYLKKVLSPEVEQEIFDYFKSAKADNIEQAIDELGGDYQEEEIRLVHIKFLSEVAN